MTQKMKAVRIHSHGGPEELRYEDAPRPEAQHGEVLIHVHAAGINPVDWKTRAGRGVGIPAFPAILGWDVSGTVAAVGEGVTAFRSGDAVYGMIRFPEIGAAYAEYATTPAEHIALKPHSIDHIHAAAVPLAALTAWQALFEAADLQAGQRVLIHAAAGGVGHLAVQLAKWKGAHIIGTASARNIAFLRELGVDEPIDYTTTDFASVVRDVDVVFDCVGGDLAARSYPVLRRGGILVSITGGVSEDAAAQYGVRAQRILVRPEAAQLAELARLSDAGLLRVTVSAIVPLAEAARAHGLSESGRTRGKIVLQVVS